MKLSPHVKKLVEALNNRDLSIEDKSLLTSAVLTRLAAIPLRDIISINDKGKLFVNDREITPEDAESLSKSAIRVLNEKAFKLIREQVVYVTFVQSAHKSVTPEDLIFGKAALWWGQEEDKYLKMLSHEDRNGNSSPLLGD